MSVVLTVISLGTRVILAYVLSAVPSIGVIGIWAAVPIGWFLADLAGFVYYKRSWMRFDGLYANVIIDISHESVDKTFQYRFLRSLEELLR